jgi:hypothetical protein
MSGVTLVPSIFPAEKTELTATEFLFKLCTASILRGEFKSYETERDWNTERLICDVRWMRRRRQVKSKKFAFGTSHRTRTEAAALAWCRIFHHRTWHKSIQYRIEDDVYIQPNFGRWCKAQNNCYLQFERTSKVSLIVDALYITIFRCLSRCPTRSKRVYYTALPCSIKKKERKTASKLPCVFLFFSESENDHRFEAVVCRDTHALCWG